MRRLDVDAFFGRGINPFRAIFAARENEGMDSFLVHHADFKIRVGWRN